MKEVQLVAVNPEAIVADKQKGHKRMTDKGIKEDSC